MKLSRVTLVKEERTTFYVVSENVQVDVAERFSKMEQVDLHRIINMIGPPDDKGTFLPSRRIVEVARIVSAPDLSEKGDPGIEDHVFRVTLLANGDCDLGFRSVRESGAK